MVEIEVSRALRGRGGSFHLDLYFSADGRTITAVTGPSGGGKTSLLRMIAGFLRPDAGRIRVNGRALFDSAAGVDLRPAQRRIGFLFQDYALFPNMTVAGNISYAGVDDAEVRRLLETADLGGAARLYPRQLSGGQQQRVALLRSIAKKPDILLLDEPLSAVDPRLRSLLQEELLKVHERFRIPMLIVSHDYEEIERMAGYLIRVDAGRVVGSGKPDEILCGRSFAFR